MRPSYDAFVFDEIRLIGRAWYAKNPDADRSDIEQVFEKLGDMAWRRLVDEKPMRQILEEIGVNPDDYLPALPPPPPKPVVNMSALHADGALLRLADGTPWRWKMVTAFDALRLFNRGELDKLRAYAAWTRSVGGNGWRVFGGWSRTSFDYRKESSYFERLNAFCFFLLEEGLRCELTAVCDSIPSDLAEQIEFTDRVADVLQHYPHLFLELANEPWKNGLDPMRFTTKRDGLLVSRGAPSSDSYPYPYVPSLGTSRHHSPRTFDWARKCGKDSYEIRGATRDVVIDNEPPGFAEHEQQWSRVNNPKQAFAAGVGAGMFCPGMTAHGDTNTMQLCVVPGPIETQCASECFRGIDAVPLDAPTWPYTRYGPDAPGLAMPVEDDVPADASHPERLTDHMHAMIGPGRAVVCNYYPSNGWVAKPANGWRIVSQDGPLVLCER